jgi:uncharacterized membrane protein YhiD involved in acid resistance
MWIDLAHQFLLAAVACVLLVAPLLRWLVPKLVDQKLAERLEIFRTDRQKELESVKAVHQAELERLRQTLSGVVQRQNLEHQIAFTRQHEKRAAVIEELHKRACDVELDAQRYTSSFGDAGNYEDIKQKLISLRDFVTVK